MGLDDVAEGVGAADDRAEPASFSERLEELEVGLHGSGGPCHEDGPAAQMHPETAQQRGNDRECAVRETDERNSCSGAWSYRVTG